jgi:hydroxyacylglutathione hydrolase
MKDLHDMGDGELQILDVREADEWEDKHIPGSVHIPWHDIDSFPSKLKKTQPIAAICGSGKRAGVAASLLQRFGAERVIHVTGGGVPEWEQLGGDVESA